MDKKLKKDFQYFLDNQDELVKKYFNKFIIIKDSKVVGDFDNEKEAYDYAKNKFELGTFLIMNCIPGRQHFTRTFHSRVAF